MGPLSIEVVAVGVLLLEEVGGALVLGRAAGFTTYADALHLSAPIAVVVAGLLVGNQGLALAMTEKASTSTPSVAADWELVDEILNVVLFLLIGLELLVLRIERGWLVAGVLVIPIVLSARWLSVAGIIGPLSWVKAQSKGAIAVLTWGGLRGSISVAMALSLPANYSRSLLQTLTYFVVVFSILVQA